MLDTIFDKADLVVIKYTIGSDHTTAKQIPVPYDITVIDAIVQCTTANALGTAKLQRNASDITDAMIMAVNHVIVRAGTIDDAYQTINHLTQKLNVICNGAADRGVVYILGYRS